MFHGVKIERDQELKGNSQVDKREEIIKCYKLLYVSHFKVKHWKINKIPFLSDLPTSQVTPVMVKSAENEA